MRCVACALVALTAVGGELSSAAEETVLFDFEPPFDAATVEARDVTVSLVEVGTGKAMRLDSGHNTDWPGITLKAPAGKWDLSDVRYAAFDATNIGSAPADVWCRVDNPGADGNRNCVQTGFRLEPGASGTLTIPLSPDSRRFSRPLTIIGMRGTPGAAGNLDPTNVTQILIFVPKPGKDQSFVIDSVRVGGDVEWLDPDTFLPFIDTFGQFRHREWPGKVRSEEDLTLARKREASELASQPGPPSRDVYGGWTTGPEFQGTGFFRTQKHQGKASIAVSRRRLLAVAVLVARRGLCEHRRRHADLGSGALFQRSPGRDLCTGSILRQRKLGSARVLQRPPPVPDL